MFWIHDIGNKKLTHLYRTMEMWLYELCAAFCRTYNRVWQSIIHSKFYIMEETLKKIGEGVKDYNI